MFEVDPHDQSTAYHVEWVTVPDRLAQTLSTRKQLADDQITREQSPRLVAA